MNGDYEEELGPDTPPAGFIPPEFREFLYTPIDDDQLEAIRMTTGIWENGVMRRYTDDEIRSKFQRIVGVRDTRTGEVDRGISGVPFISVEIGDDS